MDYPKIKIEEFVEERFGKIIEDNYRWLEKNDNNTIQFIEEQNKLSNQYFNKIPYRKKIKENLKQIWNYPKYSSPFKRGNYYYSFYNSGLQNQSVLMRQKNLEEKPQIFIDPNNFSDDSTSSLSSLSFSPCGKYLAYSISHAGSMWSDLIIIDVETKEEISPRIKDILFDDGAGYHKVVWDNVGFYYARFDDKHYDIKKKKNCKLYYRNLNETNDKLIYEDLKNPDIVYGLSITEDKRFLCLYPNFGTHLNQVLIKDLNDKDSKFISIIKSFEYESEIIGNINDELYMITNKNAPNNKIVKIDFENSSEIYWEDFIEEKDFLLEDSLMLKDKIALLYLENVSSKLNIIELETKKELEVDIGKIGTIYGLNWDKENEQLYFNFTSFSYPNEILKLNLETNKIETWKKSQIKFNTDDYITKQVWYESKDNTKIPMFITHKKSIEPNKNTPTLLYGYGGFNINITPHFSIGMSQLLEYGFVYAVANIRGGGEFGEEWHKQGIKSLKQNVFDDFIFAADYLIKNNLTSKEKLCIMGGSNGGLLVGATLVQKPDICKAAVPVVGVLDMINFHKYGCGMDWKTDYGDPEIEEDFNALLKYSPYHNIQKTYYPSTLIMTSSNDDNVAPFHSYKFTAKLQQNQNCNNPILLRVETKSGHQGGSSTTKRIEEITDKTCFILNELNVDIK